MPKRGRPQSNESASGAPRERVSFEPENLFAGTSSAANARISVSFESHLSAFRRTVRGAFRLSAAASAVAPSTPRSSIRRAANHFGTEYATASLASAASGHASPWILAPPRSTASRSRWNSLETTRSRIQCRSSMADAAATYRARGNGTFASSSVSAENVFSARETSACPRSVSSSASTPKASIPPAACSDSSYAECALSTTSHARFSLFTSMPSTASAIAARSALFTPPPRASPAHPLVSSNPGHSGRSALRSTFCASRRCIRISA
mmetsp:Transcript_10813/g.45390  ORF Transcript_10813/g.45390 Transcript_10813/m.45390 type:complete len:267 (+) Transcript_10813:1007-1807(+)